MNKDNVSIKFINENGDIDFLCKPLNGMSKLDASSLDIEHIEIIKEVMDIDEEEAEKLLALGKYLQEYFADMKYSWKVEDENLCEYTYCDRYYYIGTYDKLTEVAEYIVQNDSKYEDCWIEAINSGRTEESLSDWLDSVVCESGINAILGTYDGLAHTVSVKGEKMYIFFS